MDALPGKSARMTAARWVLWGYVGFVTLETILHFSYALLYKVPPNWWYQLPTFGLGIAAVFALRGLQRSLYRAMLLFAWAGMVCVGILLFYGLENADPNSMQISFVFHIIIFTLGLILGFKPAIQYAAATTFILLLVGAVYTGVDSVLVLVVLAYAAALPAKVVEQLIKDRTAELTKINVQLNQEVTERKRAEEELRQHRDHLEELVAARTAQLAEANQSLEASYQREQQKRQLSDTLREVAKIVSSTLEQERVVDLILAQLENVVIYHQATVALLADDRLTIVARRDETGSSAPWDSFPVSKYPFNESVLRSKQPILLPDVSRDEGWLARDNLTCIRSFINAPLLVQEQPIGVLSVGRCDEIPYTEDDTQTVFAFANQVAVALEQARLHEYELEQFERELEFAWQLQTSLLPQDAPCLAGLDIAGYSKPARQVGGDFYNYFVFDPDYLGIVVGDVSGKGMPAALMMAMSFGLLLTEVRREVTPATLLTVLNKELCPHAQRSQLNTALTYLTLRRNLRTWEARAGNAGMVMPLIRRCDGVVEWLDLPGLPLGSMQDAHYKEVRHTLYPGDVLILCSDGIAETLDEAGQMYGFDRLIECIDRSPQNAGARDILTNVLDDARAFAGGSEPYDDVTLVVVVVSESLLQA